MDVNYSVLEETVREDEDFSQIVGFKIDDELFGVDILIVEKILKNVEVTQIPDSPDFIKGVINLRGNILPIIDLRKRLRISKPTPKKEQNNWVIVLNINGRSTGFFVDYVTKVMKIVTSAVQPNPELGNSDIKSDYIKGVYQLEDKGLMALLDFNRILIIEDFKKEFIEKKKEAKYS
jgi:purine-binding chemotaxis protein CheW